MTGFVKETTTLMLTYSILDDKGKYLCFRLRVSPIHCVGSGVSVMTKHLGPKLSVDRS